MFRFVCGVLCFQYPDKGKFRTNCSESLRWIVLLMQSDACCFVVAIDLLITCERQHWIVGRGRSGRARDTPAGPKGRIFWGVCSAWLDIIAISVYAISPWEDLSGLVTGDFARMIIAYGYHPWESDKEGTESKKQSPISEIHFISDWG